MSVGLLEIQSFLRAANRSFALFLLLMLSNSMLFPVAMGSLLSHVQLKETIIPVPTEERFQGFYSNLFEVSNQKVEPDNSGFEDF